MRTLTLDQLTVHDRDTFRGVGVWRDLDALLRKDGFTFRVADAPWQRVLLLNLTFWNAAEPNDVLPDDSIDADVIAHAAWHHAARAALNVGPRPSADALFLGEAIASAFDLYLIGRTLGRVESGFLESQVPAMADAAADAGLDDAAFSDLLDECVADPDRAFEDLRQLLFDASLALYAAPDALVAAQALAGFDAHRFAPLLHHFELATWVLYARAYAGEATHPAVQEVDRELRGAPSSVDWLHARWVAPRLG